MRVGLAVLSAACFGACLFPDLSGLEGGGDAIATDALVDAPSADAIGEASDGATTNDADAAKVSFCSSIDATFCADFDESPDVAAGFSTIYSSEGGVVALDNTVSASPPASLLTGNTPLGASASAHGAVVRDTGRTPQNSATLDFDLRVDALASQGTVIEALAMVCQSATSSSLQFNLKTASSEVGEEIVGLDGGKTYTQHLFSAKVAMTQWVHVTIALTFKTPRTITVTVDSSIVVDHVAMTAAYVAGPISLFVGNAYSPGPSDGANIHYDNVVLSVN